MITTLTSDAALPEVAVAILRCLKENEGRARCYIPLLLITQRLKGYSVFLFFSFQAGELCRAEKKLYTNL
jgi:hypothetical protein